MPQPGPSDPLDFPLFTIGIAAEILHTHPRTLMMYEDLGLIIPYRTARNRRRYSQHDIAAVQALQYFTKELKVNLAGVRQLVACLRLLDASNTERPPALKTVDVSHISIEERPSASAPRAGRRKKEKVSDGA